VCGPEVDQPFYNTDVLLHFWYIILTQVGISLPHSTNLAQSCFSIPDANDILQFLAQAAPSFSNAVVEWLANELWGVL
jgi:hypothetical protein